MKNNDSLNDLDSLIRDYMDGRITPERLAQLEDVLQTDAYARKQLRRTAMIEVGIADLATSQSLFESPAGFQTEQDKKITPAYSAGRTFLGVHTSVIPWIGMAAMAVFILTLLTQDPGENTLLPIDDLVKTPIDPIPEWIEPESSVPSEEMVATKSVAFLVDKIDAEFANNKLDPTLGFSAGDFSLTRGSIHLRFQNGANMVLEGPARFSILDDMNFQLHDGTLRAIFPPNARGFQIETPGVRYKDMGTEVGLFADSLEMASQVYVYQGMVSPNSSRAIIQSQPLLAGQAVAFRNGVLQDGFSPAAHVIEPGLIGFRRWTSLQEKFRAQDGLIGYFPSCKLRMESFVMRLSRSSRMTV